MSMHPLLKDGDSVQVKPLSQKEKFDIEVGTIVLLEHNNELIVHRLVDSHDSFYVEKGDRNGSRRNISQEDVIGVVDYRKRNGKINKIKLPLYWKIKRLLRKR